MNRMYDWRWTAVRVAWSEDRADWVPCTNRTNVVENFFSLPRIILRRCVIMWCIQISWILDLLQNVQKPFTLHNEPPILHCTTLILPAFFYYVHLFQTTPQGIFSSFVYEFQSMFSTWPSNSFLYLLFQGKTPPQSTLVMHTTWNGMKTNAAFSPQKQQML